MDILKEVHRVFDVEINELQRVKNNLNESIIEVINLINLCKGKVVVCGMGKPGHIAKKIAASFSSMGIPAFMLHPAEAQHGDLGMLEPTDIIVMISNSGETKEMCDLLPNLKIMGIPIIAITRNATSTLGRYADYTIETDTIKEAENLGLAPTSSTTVELVLGDAIAVVVSKMRGFKKENFALFHPAGSLGKKLLTTVKELMIQGEDLPVIQTGETLVSALSVMSKTQYGAILVIGAEGELEGIITDGDIKRFANRAETFEGYCVNDIMSKNPISIEADELAVDALKLMEKRSPQIHCLAVTEGSKAVGLIRNHDVINVGIFL